MGKLQERDRLDKNCRSVEYNIKIDLQEETGTEGKEWIHFALDKVTWWAVSNVTKLGNSSQAEELSD